MFSSDRFNYLAHKDFQAVELPYGNGGVSMFIFLPREGLNIYEFLSELSWDRYQEWFGDFRRVQGDLLLPRFKIEYQCSLKETLERLGMGEAFDLNRADFSAMGESKLRFAIGDVLHKTFVEVNEEGTEAAAVTSVEMVLSAVPTERFRMVVDRPFFFSIQERETGTVLFMGVVVEP